MKKVITERSIRTGAGKYLAQLYADAEGNILFAKNAEITDFVKEA